MAKFTYKYFGSRRLGTISSKHGDIITPGFVSCASHGALKGMQLQDYCGDLLLVNALLCYSKADDIDNFGGIHKFMNYDKPTISDSGGFQVFGLGVGSVSNEIKGKKQSGKKFVTAGKKSLSFRDPRTGTLYEFNAKNSMETQIKLGVDFAIAFDECTSAKLTYQQVKRSMQKSHQWEMESLEYFKKNRKPYQEIYGVVQGGIYKDLRRKSANFVGQNDFFGVAIGGSLGTSSEQMMRVVLYTKQQLPDHKPIHVLGIGFLLDIRRLAGIAGDTFDCVHPSRIARHGIAIVPFEFSEKNRLNLRNKRFKLDKLPIDPECSCSSCKNYSRGYLHYLLKRGEITGIIALSIHNNFTMQRFMGEIRDAIRNENFDELDYKWFGRKIQEQPMIFDNPSTNEL
jgi:queuine tRNA-ribosyltransferase